SVGGPNLKDVGHALRPVISARVKEKADGPGLNVIVCENWKGAAETLRGAVGDQVDEIANSLIGIAEATVMRSSIDPTAEQRLQDPLSLQVQDYWQLDVDAANLVEPLPHILGLRPVNNFQHELERKIFTYNMANATIAYTGWLKGYALLSEAANDPVIARLASRAHDQVNEALARLYGFDRQEQRRYALEAMRKFQNSYITDPIARQVRDPMRKLGRDDRLVGPAMMALSEDVSPTAIAVGIAAALRYRNADDPSAEELRELVDQLGDVEALRRITGLEVGAPLLATTEAAMAELDEIVAR
ncbi:MAG TPA: hypothetical protein VEJ84_12215, partial [Acidimicrobiales bacterium]|nr:hypothetical protein [Acidimicrobiales bacterium]